MKIASVRALVLSGIIVATLFLGPIAAFGCPSSTTTTQDDGAYTRTEVKNMSVIASASKSCPGKRCPCEGNPSKVTYDYTESWTKTQSHTPMTIGAALEGLFKFLKFNFTEPPNPRTETHSGTETKHAEVTASCGEIGEIASGTLTVIETETRSGEGESGTKHQSDATTLIGANTHFQNQTWDPCTGVVTPTNGQGCP